MSADINHASMSCLSVILWDYCKTCGRLFIKHRILCINNHPFPGKRSHQIMFRKHRKRNVNNMDQYAWPDVQYVIRNTLLTISYMQIIEHDETTI